MATQQSPQHIFCGYAHEDEILFQELFTALAILRRQETISIWHYGDLLPGDQWERKIECELNTADIILLLVSRAFMASDFCWSKEMQWAITRHSTGEARVIPIILKPTPDWEKTSLGALQALPKAAKPITIWSNRGQAFEDVVKGLRKVIEDVQEEDRYLVEDYVIDLPVIVYGKHKKDFQTREAAVHQAEQWVEAVSQMGILEETTEETIKYSFKPYNDDSLPQYWREWDLIDHQQDCCITLWPEEFDFPDDMYHSLPFKSTMIRLQSNHPMLLDRMIQAGQLPYKSFEWKLAHNLNIPGLVDQIFEQTGKTPLYTLHDKDDKKKISYAEYAIQKFDRPIKHDPTIRIRVSLDTLSLYSSPVNISLIHHYPYFKGFYRAHKLFSVRKILLMLQGKISHKELWELIEEACTPEK